MFRYISHQSINFQLWDQCMEKASNGLIYGYSWYLDQVCEWNGIIKEENGIYVAVMPIPIKTKAGITFLFTPPLCQQLGVFYFHSLTIDEWKLIFDLLNEKFSYIRNYTFNENNLREWGKNQIQIPFSFQKKKNYLLSLDKNYHELEKNFDRNRVSHRGKINFLIQESQNIDDLLNLFIKNTEEKIYGGVGKKQFQQLKNLFLIIKEKKQAIIFESVSNHEAIASILLFYSNDRIYFFFSSANELGKKSNAIAVIINRLIQQYAGQNKILDFKGSDIKEIAQFYESFGSKNFFYVSISKNKLHLLIRIIQSIRKRIVGFILRKPTPLLLFHL